MYAQGNRVIRNIERFVIEVLLCMHRETELLGTLRDS